MGQAPKNGGPFHTKHTYLGVDSMREHDVYLFKCPHVCVASVNVRFACKVVHLREFILNSRNPDPIRWRVPGRTTLLLVTVTFVFFSQMRVRISRKYNKQ